MAPLGIPRKPSLGTREKQHGLVRAGGISYILVGMRVVPAAEQEQQAWQQARFVHVGSLHIGRHAGTTGAGNQQGQYDVEQMQHRGGERCILYVEHWDRLLCTNEARQPENSEGSCVRFQELQGKGSRRSFSLPTWKQAETKGVDCLVAAADVLGTGSSGVSGTSKSFLSFWEEKLGGAGPRDQYTSLINVGGGA